jgi:hypothetical protein
MTRLPTEQRRVSWRGRFLPVVVGMLLAAGAASAQTAKERHQQAQAALLKLGATVKTMTTADGAFTVVRLEKDSFGPRWQGTEADMKHLKDLLKLKFIYIQGPQFTDKALTHLEGLAAVSRLTLRCPEVTDAGLVHLQDLNTLTELAIECPKITDAGMQHLTKLTGLAGLSLSQTLVTEAGLKQLSWKNLQQLEIYNTQVAEITLADAPNLTNLHVGGAKLKALHVQGVSGLRTLRAQNTLLTDAGLADVQKLHQLQELDLSSTKITDAGLKHLQGLTKLKTLFLRGTGVTADGLIALKGLTQLEIIFIPPAAAAGAIHLKDLKCVIRVE